MTEGVRGPALVEEADVPFHQGGDVPAPPSARKTANISSLTQPLMVSMAALSVGRLARDIECVI